MLAFMEILTTYGLVIVLGLLYKIGSILSHIIGKVLGDMLLFIFVLREKRGGEGGGRRLEGGPMKS